MIPVPARLKTEACVFWFFAGFRKLLYGQKLKILK